MSKYIENLNDELKKYFNILCNNDYPEFINKYIETNEMQRLSKIGQFCGCDYTKIYNIKFWYSRLDHSIACALMTWNFTHDKNQTLMALFHDLGTPAFSHCIDYLLNDHINQKSSERDVYSVLNSSEDIKKLCLIDEFNISEMNNIDKYTIVENDKPKLCVDRLDGVMHTCLIWIRYWRIEDIKYVYSNIGILVNEDEEQELGFLNKEACDKFFEGVYEYSMALQQNEDKYVMQFTADFLKNAIKNEYITLEDLYEKTEKDIIEKICVMDKYKWDKFCNSSAITRSDSIPLNNTYYISLECKKRYVLPLCKNGDINIRLNKISDECNKLIDEYMKYSDSKYSYIDDIYFEYV